MKSLWTEQRQESKSLQLMRNGTLSQKGVKSLGNENKLLFDMAKKEHQVNRVKESDARGADKNNL